MTCIAGFTDRAQPSPVVYLGADSAVSWGTNLANHVGAAKLFTLGDGNFLIGCAGSVRFQQTVLHQFKAPDLTSQVQPAGTAEDWYPMMVLEFVPTLRECLRQQDLIVSHKDNDGGHYPGIDGNMLVAVRGQLFEVDYAFTVCHWASGIHAIGSGGPVAMGALHATYDEKPDERIRRALAVATECNTGVRPPYYLGTSSRETSRITPL